MCHLHAASHNVHHLVHLHVNVVHVSLDSCQMLADGYDEEAKSEGVNDVPERFVCSSS